MKFGLRSPSLKRSLKARTTGRFKRAMKRSINPFYGKRGMGILHPQRALYNRVYRRTTFSVMDLFKGRKGDRRKARVSAVTDIPALEKNIVDDTFYKFVIQSFSESQVQKVTSEYELREKKTKKTFILWGFLGALGAHRFYFQDYWRAIFMAIATILAPSVGVIWWLIDGFFVISRLKEINGEYFQGIIRDELKSNLNAYIRGENIQPITSNKTVEDISNYYPEDTEAFTINEDEKIFIAETFGQFARLNLPNLLSTNRLSDGSIIFRCGEVSIGSVRLQKRKHFMKCLLQDEGEQIINGELPDFLPHIQEWFKKLAQIVVEEI